MIKLGEMKLYKLGEVMKILEERFNYKVSSKQVLCKKAYTLNAYVTYNNLKYIPEDIISSLTENIKKNKKK